MNQIIEFLFMGYGAIGWIPIGLFVTYLIAKRFPQVSRELHKKDCHCNVCYPKEEEKLG